MDQLENLCSVFYPSKCCHDILIDHVIEGECFKTIIAKTLGYGIIAGSTLVKVPQILILLSARSGAGVSLFSVLLELIALTFTSSYSLANNFPISAWGEALFLMFMTTLVAFLILKYDASVHRAGLFLFTFTTFSYVLMSGLVPVKILWFLQVLNVPLVISSKLVQARVNFKNGHTGNLSGITVTLVFLGCLARIFTSIRETGDSTIIVSYILATLANAYLVYQIVAYRKKTEQFKKKESAKKTK